MPRVYKVVRRTRHKGRNLRSVIDRGTPEGKDFILYYYPGKTTVPRVGEIFCFRKLSDAMSFAYLQNCRSCRIEVWRCFAPATKQLKLAASWSKDFKKFWSDIEYDNVQLGLERTSHGTVIVPSITLISKEENH